ncbi:MAG: sugar transferase [Lachnospiraceae bacterium]|nr:sugar transferase [Lachnospiraceae bacterium]
MYEKIVKPFLDRVLSFIGLVLLSPLFGVISLIIYIDDPGPVFFVQKRVGKDGRIFHLHKFRSMYMSAPHDVPTHLLEDPEKYLTRPGRVLRRTSLDEIPQIWDILRGRMSIIGPRPALWNQNDLVAEREKYGVNAILPGLTGLAQIRGRDELEIPEKARIDGEYVQILRKGGMAAFMMDAAIFLRTIASVLMHDGVAEGGIGRSHRDQIWKESLNNIESEEYGYKKKFHIRRDHLQKKRILITGAGSYVGESFEKYAGKHYMDCFAIDTINMMDDAWRDYDFSYYDTVFHVAGIAHVDTERLSETERKRYYEVNTDLAVRTAQRAKENGVSQFIFMSSLTIYGESDLYGRKVIDEYTMPAPSGIYADSKWRADQKTRELADESFHVAVIRAPMIYGKGAKGNFFVLVKMAKWIPVFPQHGNCRSVLYIENLCEFICLLTLSGEGGIYFPQNRQYVLVSKLMQEAGKVSGNHMHMVKLLEPAVFMAGIMPGEVGKMVRKAFGNICYDGKLSRYEGLEYQIVDFETSMKRTVGQDDREKEHV